MAFEDGQIVDELLVVEAQCGDRECLDLLVDRWAPRVLAASRRLTGDAGGGEEVAQESWAAIAKGLGRLRDPAMFGPWVRAIIRRKAADWIAGRQRHRRGQATASEAAVADAAAQNRVSPADEDLRRLREAIRQLPGERRAALFLLYVEGLSVGQIASLFEVPPGTIKSRLHQARGELRALLESQGDRDDQPR